MLVNLRLLVKNEVDLHVLNVLIYVPCLAFNYVQLYLVILTFYSFVKPYVIYCLSEFFFFFFF